jgi:hypothetical protein
VKGLGGASSIRLRTSSLLGLFDMATYPIWHRLPTSYHAAIGRTVVRFAILESTWRRLVYDLLELDPKFGRVAVRSPRASDAFAMIQDLMSLRGFKAETDPKTLGKMCKDLEEFRDKIAHGVWVKHEKSNLPTLQVTAGSYPSTKGGESVKARIDPVAFNVSLKVFQSYIAGIDNAIKGVKQLAKELKPQHLALLKKRNAQSNHGSSRPNPRGRQNPAKR